MSERHVRRASGNSVVVAATELYHRRGKNKGRRCGVCGSMWTVERDAAEDFHVWRGDTPCDSAILDWVGNNVVIECC